MTKARLNSLWSALHFFCLVREVNAPARFKTQWRIRMLLCRARVKLAEPKVAALEKLAPQHSANPAFQTLLENLCQ
jgi:hypothetical protein